jgi:hypothetical protein
MVNTRIAPRILFAPTAMLTFLRPLDRESHFAGF